jgi:hypothetical protein
MLQLGYCGIFGKMLCSIEAVDKVNALSWRCFLDRMVKGPRLFGLLMGFSSVSR